MFENLNPEYQTIAKTIRDRIILHTSEQPLMLNEGKIAQQYGLSRTPIRQILQTLTICHMVETRPGKGTYATALQEGQMLRDMHTSRDLLIACSNCAVHPVPNELMYRLMSISDKMNSCGPDDRNTVVLVDTMTRLCEMLHPLIEDPLLAQLYAAVFHRMLRWRVRMFAQHPEEVWDRMLGIVSGVAQAAKLDQAGAVFKVFVNQADANISAIGSAKLPKPDDTVVSIEKERTRINEENAVDSDLLMRSEKSVP